MSGGRIDHRETIRRFETAVSISCQRHFPASDGPIWLAVSGGRDSVALLHAIIRSKSIGPERLAVIHVDHGLRDDSQNDAKFVDQLATRLNVQVELTKIDAGDSAAARSEDWARRHRYDAIKRIATAAGSRYVATAHTADDQAETVLHRLVRGTGVAGLAGMDDARPLGHQLTLIRPLLDISREKVTEYLTAIDQPWRDDATNATSDFTRNRIRHELLPLLNTFNPKSRDALCRLAESASEHADVVRCLAEERMRRLPIDSSSIPIALLSETAAAVMTECFRLFWRRNEWPEQGMTRNQWLSLVDLVVTNRSNRERQLPGGITAHRTRTAIEFFKSTA